MWSQVYDPLHNIVLSALLAAVPVVVLLGALGVFHLKAHLAALLGLASSLLISIFEFGMPVQKSLMAAVFGAAYGLLPIGWIILNVIFLYQLTLEKGHFKVLQNSIANVTEDRRLQLLLIAFAFGAFFEGAAGFGTPVAVTGAILIGIGFSPLQASGLCLIANTAPVAFGAIGTPVIALAAVTGLDLLQLSKQIGHQLPFFSLIIPFWLIWAFAGFRGMIQVWPAILVTGVCFAVPQFLVSTLHGPWLVDIIASVCSMAALTLFLRVWQPETMWLSMSREYPVENADTQAADAEPISTIFRYRPENETQITRADTVKAWLPLVILSVFVFLWGIPQFKAFLDGLFNPKLSVPGLDKLVLRVPPLVPEPRPEPAVLCFESIVGHRHGYPRGGNSRRVSHGLFALRSCANLLADAQIGAFLVADDCLHARSRIRHSVFRNRRHFRTRFCSDWSVVSDVWHAAGLAGSGTDRFGHFFQCVVWRSAKDHRPAIGTQSGLDGRRK